jgi:hypothetical protein
MAMPVLIDGAGADAAARRGVREIAATLHGGAPCPTVDDTAGRNEPALLR